MLLANALSCGKREKKKMMQWDKGHDTGNEDATTLMSIYVPAVSAVPTAMDSGVPVYIGGSCETCGRPQKHGS